MRHHEVILDRPPAEPTAVPQSERDVEAWQEANRTWWNRHPMRYDWKTGVQHAEFTPEFYREIDRRFFSDAHAYMPWRWLPFEHLIDFTRLAGMDVLEVGVGMGSHAQLLASHSRSFVGIDLTDYAVRATSERLKVFDIDGRILQMDAEHMEFEDDSFDFIWSWGVIHHSANTPAILGEMRRVLRPGGRAVVMVYHRNPWNYYVVRGLLGGLVTGELWRTRSIHSSVQSVTDGALARFYTCKEWAQLCSRYFSVAEIEVYGSKAELIPLPGGRLKSRLLAIVPDGVGRFFTNELQVGSFLVSTLENPP
ncbi:MAG TPA: class I SAM-dependent methyltransferase [Chloroflexota bacterium]|nr:class I SAM-dependent methyltransferase [Chloroflexota bacterium]